MAATVSLIKGEDRYQNIIAALQAIETQIDPSRADWILVEPNLVSTDCQLAVTHVEAVRAVLDWLRRRTQVPIVVGEGTAFANTWDAFENFGYTRLPDDYRDLSLVDFNTDETVNLPAYDWRLRPIELLASKTAIEAPFRISVAPPKTHDTVLVTLGLKNMVMGGLISNFAKDREKKHSGLLGRVMLAGERVYAVMPEFVRTGYSVVSLKERMLSTFGPSSKAAMHQGLPVMHFNLAIMAPHFYPHLNVLDGYEAMEGNGPSDGDPVPWRVAMAGTDWLATDVLAAYLMGFPLEQVGYLAYAARAGFGTADLKEIEIAGNAAVEEIRRPFKRHAIARAQLRWHSDRVSERVERVLAHG